MVSSAVVVFQGELAVSSGVDNSLSDVIKTTVPSSCNVLILYNKLRSIGALSHLDDYTDVADIVEKIDRIAKVKFSAPLSSEYKGTILGGTDDPFSVKSKKSIMDRLKKFNIQSEVLPLSKDLSERPQIAFDLKNGEIKFLKGKEINQRLEYLQRREYGDWNSWLNRAYSNVPGKDIPYFEGKIANRFEKEIPEFKANTKAELEETRRRERIGELVLPVLFERKVVVKKAAGAHKDL